MRLQGGDVIWRGSVAPVKDVRQVSITDGEERRRGENTKGQQMMVGI